MRRKTGLTVVEVTIVVAILALLAAIALPAFFQNRQKRHAARCGMQLDGIAQACRRYAGEVGGFPRQLGDLVPAYLTEVPSCPSGGAYTLGTPEGDPPVCSIPDHHL